jgi:biopolymer transport protein ExbB
MPVSDRLARHARPLRALALVLALALTPAVLAQEQASGNGDTASGQASGSASPASGEQGQGEAGAAQDELMKAYQKEYAFLAQQKRDLQQRIERFQQQANSRVQNTEASIESLQAELAELRSRAETLQQRINEAERQREAAEKNADVLAATFQQAGATFGEHGRDFTDAEAYAQRPQADKLAAIFGNARQLLGDLSALRREPGAFYSREGSKVEGTLVHYGDIAKFGVAANAAGVLVPAGGGELKLWRKPAPDVANTLADGGTPETLSLFLYDSLDQAVSAEGEGSIIATINDGGVIGWLIVGLGGLAALLILARIVFLQRASASTGRIVKEVGEHVRRHNLDDAIEVCRRRKGSTAAVVGAALRNIHRGREQLEDIVNESILHESSHLDRFGSFILVIAAVSPLLGLLGTVTGMISTFEVITEHGTGDPKLLSGGISVALVTTELGLIVAIPTLLIGNLLSGWAERIKDDMQKAALRVTNLYEETTLRAAA